MKTEEEIQRDYKDAIACLENRISLWKQLDAARDEIARLNRQIAAGPQPYQAEAAFREGFRLGYLRGAGLVYDLGMAGPEDPADVVSARERDSRGDHGSEEWATAVTKFLAWDRACSAFRKELVASHERVREIAGRATDKAIDEWKADGGPR